VLAGPFGWRRPRISLRSIDAVTIATSAADRASVRPESESLK
jgi:hypothetical protein